MGWKFAFMITHIIIISQEKQLLDTNGRVFPLTTINYDKYRFLK